MDDRFLTFNELLAEKEKHKQDGPYYIVLIPDEKYAPALSALYSVLFERDTMLWLLESRFVDLLEESKTGMRMDEYMSFIKLNILSMNELIFTAVQSIVHLHTKPTMKERIARTCKQITKFGKVFGWVSANIARRDYEESIKRFDEHSGSHEAAKDGDSRDDPHDEVDYGIYNGDAYDELGIGIT